MVMVVLETSEYASNTLNKVTKYYDMHICKVGMVIVLEDDFRCTSRVGCGNESGTYCVYMDLVIASLALVFEFSAVNTRSYYQGYAANLIK